MMATAGIFRLEQQEFLNLTEIHSVVTSRIVTAVDLNKSDHTHTHDTNDAWNIATFITIIRKHEPGGWNDYHTRTRTRMMKWLSYANISIIIPRLFLTPTIAFASIAFRINKPPLTDLESQVFPCQSTRQTLQSRTRSSYGCSRSLAS